MVLKSTTINIRKSILKIFVLNMIEFPLNIIEKIKFITLKYNILYILL